MPQQYLIIGLTTTTLNQYHTHLVHVIPCPWPDSIDDITPDHWSHSISSTLLICHLNLHTNTKVWPHYPPQPHQRLPILDPHHLLMVPHPLHVLRKITEEAPPCTHPLSHFLRYLPPSHRLNRIINILLCLTVEGGLVVLLHPLGLPMCMHHFHDCIVKGSYSQIYPIIMQVTTRHYGREQASKSKVEYMFRAHALISIIVISGWDMRVEVEGVVKSFA